MTPEEASLTKRKVDEYNARGKSQVVHWEPCQDCPDCGLLVDGYQRVDGTCFIVCTACDAAKIHAEDCRLLRALRCPVSIYCEPHKLDVCPDCDTCTCLPEPKESGE